ncbi:MAG: hypothetical protein QW374_02415 [Candidatus Bathyarchaeia archaeon]|nr:hypothetical protein [Candidatus Bathyarchaeota archaeon]
MYGCGGYGERLACPSYSPTSDETRRNTEIVILVEFLIEADIHRVMARFEK